MDAVRTRVWMLLLALGALPMALRGPCAHAAESAHPLAPPRAERITAQVLPAAPDLDGRLDDWPAGASLRIDQMAQALPGRREDWTGPADASLRGWAGRYGDDLYFAFVLRDDRTRHDPSAPWWHGDSIELFLDADRSSGTPAATSYGPNCWQIFFMPANPDLTWGVVFRGPSAKFGDGGLRGVRLEHRTRGDETTIEVRMPLHNFGLPSGEAATLGFALALNDVDSDVDPAPPSTYLSWNGGFELFKRPNHFGTLDLPAHRVEAPPSETGLGWTWLWVVLAGVGLALLLVGPGTHLVRRLGWKVKVVALAGVVLAALWVRASGADAVEDARRDVRERLTALAARTESVVTQARALGALRDADETERAGALQQLLLGDGIVCRPGIEAAAFVCLHPNGRHPAPGAARTVSLTRERAWPLALDAPVEALHLACVLPADRRPRQDAFELGTFRLEAADGTRHEHPVRIDAGMESRWTETVRFPSPQRWQRLTWMPRVPGLGASLASIHAERDGTRHAAWLARRTRADVPVLAHSSSVHAGRALAQRETLQTPLPALRGGADRLWLLLRPTLSYPELLGDAALATVRVHYEIGASHQVVLRNGEHLGSTRLPIGVRRPGSVRSRVAWRSGAAAGFESIQEAIPIALDTERRPRALEIENHEAGGTLAVLAATVVRSRRAPDEGILQVVYDDDAPADRCHLVRGAQDYPPHVRPARDPERTVESERVRAFVGPAEQPTPLELVGEVPRAAFEAQQRSNTALLFCLGLAAVLFVLLVIDWTDHVGRLTHRLALGVLAAALIPFTVTLFLVERNQRRGVEADAAASVRASLDDLDGRVRHVASRARHAAQALARQLHAQADGRTAPSLPLRSTRDASAALEPGWAATAWIVGARLPPVHVPLSSTAGGLSTPRFLSEVQDRPGLHVSPWDGCVAVGTARAGREDDWVHVVVGVRVEDALLDTGAGAPPRTALLLDRRGTLLAAAGDDVPAVRAALSEQARAAGGTLAGESSPHVGQDAVVGTTALSDRLVGETEGPILAAGIAQHHLSRLLADEREPLIWLGLLGLTFMVCAAALVARHVAGPVRALAEASDAVRLGDFEVPVPAAGRDEVGRLAVAFDQMRQGMRQRVEDLATLRGAQERLTTSLDFDARTHTALAVLREETGADRAGFLESRGRHGPVAWVAQDPPSQGDEPEWTDRAFAIEPEGVLAVALTAAQPVALDAADTTSSAAESRLLARASAWLALPVRVGDHLLGLVLLGWDDAARRPRERQSKLLEPLTGIVASALNNAHLYRLAALDEVTRLPGATAFEAVLRRDVEQAVAGGPAVTLLRIGLDNIEHVRRDQGVEAAHELTRAVAQALQGIVVDPLRLGRTRSDELAACTVDTSPGAARELAEAVRRRVAAVDVPTDAETESLATTVSIGMAACPTDARSLEFLFDAAGRALEAARREGGDRIEDAARIDGGAVEVPPFEEGAIFRNERMVAVVEAARRAARADASILITGETGTGKEVIANLVHRRSDRVQRAFVSVNCAAFPETLLESELFGYERGAFTGADRRREGRFELADGGTLFLDEIGDLSASAQVKLLRVLQERQFTRLGGSRTITVDVRIIAATNRDLEAAVREGTFREDLYYRLNVIRLTIPPLRERREEIPPLVEQFLTEFRRRAGRGPTSLSPGAMDVLYRHPWPGNVRELKNVIERCAVLCDEDVVAAEHLQLDGGASDGGADLLPRRAPRDDLNPRQRKLLDHLARHGRCTNREYYEMTSTSPRTGLRDLQDLMNRGLLVREGKRRGAVYRLP